ncbi:hypothetical protein [Fluviicola sp.]|uniref:hypothetical protein n=1 Tax=Fluviicola sp. TaxID=1917219 RepID=UPI003D28132C
MTSKTIKFLIGSILLAIVLLACVPFCDFILSFVFISNQNQSDTTKEILAGITSETIRAFISCYLYSVTDKKGSNLIHGIKHGLLYSALIGSLYLILGALYFQLNSPLRFLIADTFILTVQGVVSGFILYSVFKEKKNEKTTNH